MKFRASAPRPSILVVDDDPDVRGLLAILLNREGYDAVTAVDGEAALAHAGDDRIGLILLDLQMPRVDGTTFCRAYRERGGRARIVLMTAAEIEPGAVARIGFDDYIAKPFDVDVVLETVARHLAAR
jgi:two-component system, OmpR family, response regulator MprA